jgi:rubredoxin
MSENVQPDRRLPAPDRRSRSRGGRRETDGVAKFTCAKCGHGESGVKNGRPVLGQIEEIYRRWRRCKGCGFVYKTREMVEVE